MDNFIGVLLPNSQRAQISPDKLLYFSPDFPRLLLRKLIMSQLVLGRLGCTERSEFILSVLLGTKRGRKLLRCTFSVRDDEVFHSHKLATQIWRNRVQRN